MTDYKASRPHDDDRVTNLLRDVAFNRHSMNDGHHVSPYDNGKIQIGTDGIIVKLTQGINEEAFKRTLSQATRATIGLDLNVPQAGDWEQCDEYAHTGRSSLCGHLTHSKAENDTWEGQVPYGADWEEMLKGGLQTALESQVIVFQVQGVSRTCTHQIVRTRNAAYHQQSQRASYYGGQPEARMPESVWLNQRARDAWVAAKKWSDRAYRIACEEDISYQDARFVLLEGTNNYIMCEYSLREFINVFAYRGCSMFSWEIVHVMREMRRLLIEAHLWLEPYIKISCEKTSPDPALRKCTFQGWEEVEGQCSFPWAKDDNRTFISTAHGIKKRPGMTPVLSDRSLPSCPSCGSEDKAIHIPVSRPSGSWSCFHLWHKPTGQTSLSKPVTIPSPLDDLVFKDCPKSLMAHKHADHEWKDDEDKSWYCGGFPEEEMEGDNS